MYVGFKFILNLNILLTKNWEIVNVGILIALINFVISEISVEETKETFHFMS